MAHLCPKCHFLGKSKNSFITGNIYIGIAEILVGLITLVAGGIEWPITLKSIVAIIIILAGTKQIIEYYRGGKICPKCGNKDMLSLDDPEAINLIKRYDLKVGENPPPNSQNEPSQDSLETSK